MLRFMRNFKRFASEDSKLVDDPKKLTLLPPELEKLLKIKKNLKPYPERPIAYVPYYEFKHKTDQEHFFHVIKKCTDRYTYEQYLNDRQFELKNLVQLPVTNEEGENRQDETTEQHTKLQYELDEHVNTPKVRRYMEAVVEGLRGNPYLSLRAKKKRLEFYKKYFKDITIKKDDPPKK